MHIKGYCNIPDELFYYITFLTRALPIRSAKTFIELLMGSLLTQSGFVTSAIWILDMARQWPSYYKWLETGQWSYLKLMRQWTALFLKLFAHSPVYLAIDDSIVLRHSKKAPMSQIHHQHGNKTNLSQYVRGQCWVALAAIVKRSGCNTALPLLLRLTPQAGNSGKLVIARSLIRALLEQLKDKAVTVLVDSWYMRRSFIEPVQAYNMTVIGQVRIDTVLYKQPWQRKGRGRPRKYGTRYTKEEIKRLPLNKETVQLYGREQQVNYRTAVAKARFLNGQSVRFVWCEFEDSKGKKRPRLLLSTDTQLSGLDIIIAYEKRWSIEPMFNQLKNAWGMKQTWQKTRKVLHRWVHIIALGYVIPQLLTIKCPDSVLCLIDNTPWRKNTPITAGRIRMGLIRYFSQVRVRDWWDGKSQKFQPPDTDILRRFEDLL